RASIDATRHGQLCAEIAGIGLVSSNLFLLDLDFCRCAFLVGFHLSLDFFDYFERMHVDVAIRAELRALAATDAPVLDDDLQVRLASNRTDRALSHAKRVATGSTSCRHQKM